MSRTLNYRGLESSRGQDFPARLVSRGRALGNVPPFCHRMELPQTRGKSGRGDLVESVALSVAAGRSVACLSAPSVKRGVSRGDERECSSDPMVLVHAHAHRCPCPTAWALVESRTQLLCPGGLGRIQYAGASPAGSTRRYELETIRDGCGAGKIALVRFSTEDR